VRGAFNKLLTLTSEQRKQGVVTASSGNHGTAVAFGLSALKIKGMVFFPETASSVKIDNIQQYDVPLQFFGTDCMKTELHAIQYAAQHNVVYISPYNDWQVIHGQGTIGVELTRQLKKIDVILVPVGGGGLIAGIAAYVKSISPATKVIGCLPKNSPVMAESIKADHIIDMETQDTLSDATAGGIEPNAITFALCQKWVDDYILVSEDEIQDAIRLVIKSHRLLTEGASGVAVASLLKNSYQFYGKNVVVILSGGNISINSLQTILNSSKP
jgi:threonine dehydratase